MKERMRQLGGTLNLTSTTNQGTQVTATLRLSHVQVPVSSEMHAILLPTRFAGTRRVNSKAFHANES